MATVNEANLLPAKPVGGVCGTTTALAAAALMVMTLRTFALDQVLSPGKAPTTVYCPTLVGAVTLCAELMSVPL